MRVIAAGVLALLIVPMVLLVVEWVRREPYVVSPMTFDGPSESLKGTVIVPTLDTPIPAGKSAIWCASFQVAWNRLKNDVVGEPIQIEGAQEVADRLNAAPQSEADLNPGDYYAEAGWGDVVIDRMESEFIRRFPNAPRPDIPRGNLAVSFGYLRGEVRFRYPYFDNAQRFAWRDATGQETEVASFGIRAKDSMQGMETFRDQGRVLYSTHRESQGDDKAEFALDPYHSSRPNQLVLARIKRKESLADTLADLKNKLTQKTLPNHESKLGPNDTFLVPNMHWRIVHRFRELEKTIVNKTIRGPIETRQIIHLRLDRSGAAVESQAWISVKSAPRDFEFNRPFLVYLHKRGAAHPFFVMWVDNDELLGKK